MYGKKDNKQSMHQAFQEALVLELLKDPNPTPTKRPYVTKNTALPNIRLTRPIEIHQQILGKQAPCLFCRWSRQNKRGCTPRVITKSNHVARTRVICSHCRAPLCIECFFLFYYFVA